ncbi:MAG TPA: nucleoside-triphosphatase, partial [Dehalococcoidia bacterium]|nr:nucleoside-triphosphatase [Dehalococcoidia bacterium]
MRMLVTGSPGCGKTAFCQRVIDSARLDGSTVGGVLAPAVCFDGIPIGADAIDLATRESAPIARLASGDASFAGDANRPVIMRPGLDLARAALERAVRQRFELIVVDEFGPLELAGGGIRQEAVDAWNCGREVLLVVRAGIVDEVVRALGRPPDLRVVPEARPLERQHSADPVAFDATLS